MAFRNQGAVDRMLRVALGMLLMTFGHGWIAALGVIPFLTGAIGYCPLYRVFGFSTLASEPWKSEHT